MRLSEHVDNQPRNRWIDFGEVLESVNLTFDLTKSEGFGHKAKQENKT